MHDFISSSRTLEELGSINNEVGKLLFVSIYASIDFVLLLPLNTNFPFEIFTVSSGYCLSNDDVLSNRCLIVGTNRQGNVKVRIVPAVSSNDQLTIPTPCIFTLEFDIPVMVRSGGNASYSFWMNSERSLVIHIDEPESQITVLGFSSTLGVLELSSDDIEASIILRKESRGLVVTLAMREWKCLGTSLLLIKSTDCIEIVSNVAQFLLNLLIFLFSCLFLPLKRCWAIQF